MLVILTELKNPLGNEFDEKLGLDVYSIFDEIDKNFMLKPGQDVK